MTLPHRDDYASAQMEKMRVKYSSQQNGTHGVFYCFMVGVLLVAWVVGMSIMLP
jgi:hypothetical protein